MILYHRTNAGAAIVDKRFRDARPPGQRGVWLSDAPLNRPDAAVHGEEELLRVSIPVAVIRKWERPQDGPWGVRVFLMPAALVNSYGPPQAVSEQTEARMKRRRRRRLQAQIDAAGGMEPWTALKMREAQS